MRFLFAAMLFGGIFACSGCALLEDSTRSATEASRTPIAEPADLPVKRQPSVAADKRLPAPVPPPIVISQRTEPGEAKADGRGVALRRPAANATTAPTVHPIMQVGAIADGGSQPIRARVATVRVVQTD